MPVICRWHFSMVCVINIRFQITKHLKPFQIEIITRDSFEVNSQFCEMCAGTSKQTYVDVILIAIMLSFARKSIKAKLRYQKNIHVCSNEKPSLCFFLAAINTSDNVIQKSLHVVFSDCYHSVFSYITMFSSNER